MTPFAGAVSAPDNPWRPTHAVEPIVGTPAGGDQDRPARMLTRILAAVGIVDVPMKVTNIAGKGGGNARDALRARAGDGYVVSISALPLVNHRIFGVSDFDYEVCPPLQDARALFDQLKADPAAATVALATALGSINHLAMGKIVQHPGGDPRRLQLRVFVSARP